jgi:peptide/nickel transport system permease protein
MRRLWAAATPILCVVLLALLVPILPLPDPLHIDVAHQLASPSAAHLLGQDEYGRDVLSRLLWGSRTTLAVSVAASLLACIIGVILGLVGGTLRGITELLTVRSMDVVLCFPPLLLALLVVTLVGPGATTLIPVLAVLYLPGFTRVVYAGVLGLRTADFVVAVRVLGGGPLRIMLRTILPNVAGPIMVQLSLAAASAIVLESGLSFLGLGVVPPAASWGLMIGAARATMVQAPLLLLWPCLALVFTILAMNLLCDAVRDAMEPRAAPPRRPRDRLLPGLFPPSPAQLLEIRDLTIEIFTPSGPIRPVRDASLSIAPGETLAVVGESGSGKSLTGLAAIGLLPNIARIAQGSIALAGQDIRRASPNALRRLRGGAVGMVFQDALGSLNPVHTVGAQIVEAIAAHRPRAEARREAIRLLEEVGIADPERRVDAYPHELSGGMRQRAMIAMAIANNPRLLIADEPTTALDVTIQAQVLRLLGRLRRDRGMALLFITHNLPVVTEIADRVAVMYAGAIVEEGPAADVFAHPLHPYTRALCNSVPALDGRLPAPIPGTVPLPQILPPGCLFAPRCGHAEPACDVTPPPLFAATPQHRTRCRRWKELA